ncbi:hypothetical protein F5Y13DRAFT_118375 [Hypoxylon sp. FL1857]|nr:hypothetical protein F5Y13DRAFT_118375 [Hypoxylon sp. FL1857]
MSSFTTLRTALRARPAPILPATGRVAAARQIHQSPALRSPYKDDMDRESLKPKAHEYTQSGTDDEVATKKDAAYNPHKTDPETETRAAAEESNGNPLNGSPANKGLAEAGSGKEEDRPHGGQKKASGGGDAPKKGRTTK